MIFTFSQRKFFFLSIGRQFGNTLPSMGNITKMSKHLLLSDNDFEHLSPDIKNLKNLRILAIRDNELVDVPEVFFNINRDIELQNVYRKCTAKKRAKKIKIYIFWSHSRSFNVLVAVWQLAAFKDTFLKQ